ncbi:MAG: electron transfer flavoprotein subunit alpha/FixB family protein [Fuerstiella sp.]|nr:electron transfer flavoprotein subunit alpha/FixB family protein [Fuerstiella sp.]MCP4855004.1 electron transfer flavoprotein subunit alpha/FixB family protein [Fuerstiella sp.]
MQILVVAEHDGTALRPATLSALTFAQSVAQVTDGTVQLLVPGHELASVVAEAVRLAPVLIADSPDLASPVADRSAHVIAETVKAQNIDLLVAASTSQAKDIVGRAGGLLGGAMASDVTGHSFHENELLLERPIHAGAAVATVSLLGTPKIVTIRPSSYSPATPQDLSCDAHDVQVEPSSLPSQTRLESVESGTSTRPDVTDARVVVSGGRAFRNSDDFERIVGGLADVLDGATGSSRSLVDAGITPNDLQVGQTGKIVAPELYVALGISGAMQHLAGMKNSRTIVAINNDPEAPIFQVADYGLVADVYEAVPEMVRKIRDTQAN